MFAQLGDLLFENLQGFNEFTKTGSAVYAEHALIDGKPRLQKTGNSLSEISIVCRFHASFCNPGEQLNTLKTFRDEGKILPLLWGNGNVEGDFVIVDLEETIEHADQQANVFSYLVNLSLKEYVTADRLQIEQQENIKKAKAVGDKKPVAKKKTNPTTCPQDVTKTATNISNCGAVIDNVFTSKGGPQTPSDKSTVKTNLTSIGGYCDQLQRQANDPNSCVIPHPGIGQKAATLKIEANYFFALVDSSPMQILNSRNILLQSLIRELRTAARPLVTQSITRK